MSKGARICLLRVADCLYFRSKSGEYSSDLYYQHSEICRAFERLSVHPILHGFGRVCETEQKGLYDFRTNGFCPLGTVVCKKGPVELLVWNHARMRETLRSAIAEADVVWSMVGTMQGLASVWLAKRTKPVVVQLVGDPLMALRHALRKPWGTLAGLVAGTLVGEAIRRADGAIFVSHALKRKYWTPGPQPVCVANESRIPEAWVCGEKHVHLRSVDTPLRLVFAGRLSPEKGLDVLLRALAGTPGVSLTVIGAGPQTPKLEALARALTVDNRVCFAGGQPWNQSLLRYIGTHDALVLPSFTEGLPLVLAEAMSQAIPVIATRVGGIPEIVTHGVNGLLVPPGDLPRLAEAICALRDDPGLYSILASNARRTALENTTEVQYGRAAEFILNIWRQKTSEGGADSGGSNA